MRGLNTSAAHWIFDRAGFTVKAKPCGRYDMNMVIKISIVILVVLIAPLAAYAEPVKFEKEYTYQASDIDSKVSSRAIALEQVKRALLEQLGTYLVSETEVKNYKMTKDQVTTLTAGIVSAEVVEEKWDGRTYYLKAKIVADPEEVAKSVDALRMDVQKSKELEDSKKKAAEAMKEVARLRKKMELVKTDTKKQGEYANAINVLSARDWLDKAMVFAESKNYTAAIDACNNAINLDSQDAFAYSLRGFTYNILGNLQEAIKDYDEAIRLKPQVPISYVERGTAYSRLGNQQQAIKDYNKAIKLDPKNTVVYCMRGIIYGSLGKPQLALRDFSKAIALKPLEADAYYGRALAYDDLGDRQLAINDAKIAAKLGNKLVLRKLNC